MPVTLGEIAEASDAELVGGDAALPITGVATLQSAGKDQVTFLANRRYYPQLAHTAAAAVILAAGDLAACPVAALLSADPYLGFVKAVRHLHPEAGFAPGVDPNAAVHPSASVPPDCYIGAGAVLAAGVSLGRRTYIAPGCHIGEQAVIGEATRLCANVVIAEGVVLGQRVIVHPGAVIGADGFGMVNDNGAWLKIPQLGTVVVGDDVEIGANTTIDRGALDDTRIGDGVKIDNQVQIGHNVTIGAHTAIAGQAGIAGSTVIGEHCMIGGAAAINGHVQLADKVVITGMSGVSNSIKAAGVYSGGAPAIDNVRWRKSVVRLRQLDGLARRLAVLERRLEESLTDYHHGHD